MSNPNPRPNPRSVPPRRSLRTLLPYLLLFAVIGVVIWLAFFTGNAKTHALLQTELAAYLQTNAGVIDTITGIVGGFTPTIENIVGAIGDFFSRGATLLAPFVETFKQVFSSMGESGNTFGNGGFS